MDTVKTTLKSVFGYLYHYTVGARPGAVVLAYHSVSDDNDALFTVSVELFEKHMKLLADGSWNVIHLSQLANLLSNKGEIPEKTVVLTFDDAYIDYVKNAIPIMEKYKFPSAVFVPTAFIGREMRHSKGQVIPVMDASTIRRLLSSPFVEIGSHTHTHPNLTEIDTEMIAFELVESKRILKENFGVTNPAFAYPKGKRKGREIEAVRAIYSIAVAGGEQPRVNDSIDLVNIPRRNIFSDTTVGRLLGILSR